VAILFDSDLHCNDRIGQVWP